MGRVNSCEIESFLRYQERLNSPIAHPIYVPLQDYRVLVLLSQPLLVSFGVFGSLAKGSFDKIQKDPEDATIPEQWVSCL